MGNKEWVEHFSSKNSVEKTTWNIQTSANTEEEQKWTLGDGISAYVSRIGFCKHDAEKYISTLRLTNLITDIEHYMKRFMQVTDYS